MVGVIRLRSPSVRDVPRQVTISVSNSGAKFTMKRAYSYIRFSSDKQAKGDSIRRQEKLRDRWIENNQPIILDDTLKPDEGVSSTKGDNLDPKKGNLGKFLEKCRQGKIERNSYLIFERIDRFSRQSIWDVGSILSEFVEQHALKLVFLQPAEQIIDASNIRDTHNVMSLVMQLQLAYDESEKKSERLAEVWNKKKKDLKDGKILTRHLPAWIILDEEEDKLLVDAEKGKALNIIFKLSADGLGCQKILNTLQDENIPAIARPNARTPNPVWTINYISALLNDRRLLGEFQPKTQRGNNRRKTDGAVIRDYFPVVIDEDLFNKSSQQKKYRKTYKVIESRKFINLFVGLVHCLGDGRKMTCITRTRTRNGKKRDRRYLVSTGKRNGETFCPHSTEYFSFRGLMMSTLNDLNIRDALYKSDSGEDENSLRVNIEATKDRIKVLEDKIKDPRWTSELDNLLDLKVEAKLKLEEYKITLENLELSPTPPKDQQRINFKELKKALRNKAFQQEFDSRIRSILPTIIDRIDLNPCSINRRACGYGKLYLKSGVVKGFLVYPMTHIDRPMWFQDKNGKESVTFTRNGIVWTELYKGKKVILNRPYEKLKTSKYSITPDADDIFNELKKVNHEFMNAEYYGDNKFEGIPPHLIMNKKPKS